MSFSIPTKRIATKAHLDEFLHSSAYEDYIGYIERLNDAVKNLKIDSTIEMSNVGYIMAPKKKKKNEADSI